MSLRDELTALDKSRVAKFREIGEREEIDPALLLAMAHRESGMRNIVGDSGHGRGIMQIDDRFHADWLKQRKGCSSGSFRTQFDSAFPPGRVPSLIAGVRKACELLHQNLAFAESNGVPSSKRLRFALAAYDCGPGNAINGFRAGDVDKFTTGGTTGATCWHSERRSSGYSRSGSITPDRFASPAHPTWMGAPSLRGRERRAGQR